MLYNTGLKLGSFLTPIEQKEIYECPEFFAMSRDEIIQSGQCPDSLKRALDEMPWTGRHNVIQVRPQDWRTQHPVVLGAGWHVDVNARLNDGTVRVAKSPTDFHLMVVSFGEVAETDFIATPMELPDVMTADHGHLFGVEIHKQAFEVVSNQPCQLAEYTSTDIHRLSTRYRLGRLRLLIVAFESDDVPSGGAIMPSLAERKAKGLTINLDDHTT